MTYRWEVDSAIEITRSKPVKRYLVAPLGGYFPVMVKIGANSLVVAHRTGDFHNGPRGRTEITLSHDGGESWSTSRVVADHASDCRNVAMGVTSDGTLVLSYVTVEYEGGRPDAWTGFKDLFVIRSEDGGETWSEPHSFTGVLEGHLGERHGASPYGKIVELADGTLLMNVYTHGVDEYGHHLTHIIRSKDGGLTWGDPTTLPVDAGDETALLALPSGKVLAAARRSISEVSQKVCVTSSTDGGRTWSEPQDVTGPMEIPADLVHLADGRVLMTYGYRNAPFGVRAVVSRDEGETWDHDNTVVLVNDSMRIDCGYPSSAQMDDGSILTAYYAYESSGPFQDDRIRGLYGINYGPHGAVVKYQPSDLP